MKGIRQIIRSIIAEVIEAGSGKNIYYHGTGEKNKVKEALKNNSFKFHKSGGVENGIYLTTNEELAFKYSQLTNGDDKGVVEVILTKEPKIKVYKNAAEAYEEETSYSNNVKDSILKYKEDMLSKGYDGTKTSSDDVILIFKEKIDIVKPI